MKSAVEGGQGRPGLSRERLVGAALEVVAAQGLDALTMRSLADRLEVKAASLYWHVRDRRDLLELLADSILARVPSVDGGAGWRRAVTARAAALGEAVAAQRDATRILLEVPDALDRSTAFASMVGELAAAGLGTQEARDVARMVMVHVITGVAPSEAGEPRHAAVAAIAVDSGSRGVLVRRGEPMEALFRVARDRAGAAPAVERGDTVIVRRLRGVGQGEIELNPSRPWTVQVQGPTWNTTLDLGGLDVRGVKLDSGAAKVECFLPRPKGVVPLVVSGGVAGVSLHRPPGVAVLADVSSGAVRVTLDGDSHRAVIIDTHWRSEGAADARDRYELRIAGGAVQVSLDSAAPATAEPAPEPPAASGEGRSALDFLLDGVETLSQHRQASAAVPPESGRLSISSARGTVS